MFSLSGATPDNHTLYERATGKATGHSFIMAGLHCAHVRVHAHITMGLNYAWPSLVSYHLSHVFGRAPQPSDPKPPPAQLPQGGGSDRTRHGLVQNIQGTVTLVKNILVNSVISVWKVRKKNLLHSMCGILPLLLYFSLTLHARRIFFLKCTLTLTFDLQVSSSN